MIFILRRWRFKLFLTTLTSDGWSFRFSSCYLPIWNSFRHQRRAFHEILEDVEVGSFASSKGIDFSFNCPENPHAGGAWEREVRSIKRVLDKLLKGSAMREETLISALIEAENIINSQPLTYVPINEESTPALTPNALLYGFDAQAAVPGKFSTDDPENSRRRWKNSQVFAEHFWQRWIKEYLPEMTRRTKWHDKIQPLKIGDLVIIVDHRARRNE